SNVLLVTRPNNPDLKAVCAQPLSPRRSTVRPHREIRSDLRDRVRREGEKPWHTHHPCPSNLTEFLQPRHVHNDAFDTARSLEKRFQNRVDPQCNAVPELSKMTAEHGKLNLIS